MKLSIRDEIERQEYDMQEQGDYLLKKTTQGPEGIGKAFTRCNRRRSNHRTEVDT